MFRTVLSVSRLALCGITAAVAILTTPHIAQANLLRNGSFEDIDPLTIGLLGQALLPAEWEQVGITADTFTFPGPGVDNYGILMPDTGFQHFQDMTAAQDGNRFVAGGDFVSIQEGFGQLLTAPLTAGETYRVTTYLYQDNPNNDIASTYEVLLSDTADYTDPDAVSLGLFSETTGVPEWEFRSLSFTAPVNAADLPYFILRPLGGYPGMDSLELEVAATVATPEPGTLGLLALGVFSAIGVGTFPARRKAGQHLAL